MTLLKEIGRKFVIAIIVFTAIFGFSIYKYGIDGTLNLLLQKPVDNFYDIDKAFTNTAKYHLPSITFRPM